MKWSRLQGIMRSVQKMLHLVIYGLNTAVNGMCKIQPVLLFHSYSASGVKNMIPNQLLALKSLTQLISEELSPIISAIADVSFC